MMFWAFVMEIPTGVIADKFGRKYSVALGCLFSFIAYLIYGSIPSFTIFLLAEFLVATGLALISGAAEALLYDSLKESNDEEKFKSIYGRSFSFGSVAAIISAPLGGLIASKYGLNIPMIFTSVPFLIAAFIMFFTKEPGIVTAKSKEQNYFKIAKNGISFFIHHKILRSMAINGIFVYTGCYFLVWFYQPVLQKIGISIFYFGFIRALFSISAVLLSQNLQFTEKLFGSSKSFFKVTAIITAISLLLIGILPSIYTVLLAIVLVGGLGSARFSALNSYMNIHIPSEQRATILSSISMLNRVVLIGLNPLIGFIADRSLGFTFIIIGTISVVTLFVFPIKFESADKTTVKSASSNEFSPS